MKPVIVEHDREQSGSDQAGSSVEEEQPKAASLVPSELPILSALFGEKRVRAWCGSFLSDEEPIEDGQSED